MVDERRRGGGVRSLRQAQKEFVHNDALQTLDLLIDAVVGDVEELSTPGAAVVGDCYLVPSDAQGDWAGQDGSVAMLTGSGWRFAGPHEGMRVMRRGDGCSAVFRGGEWEYGHIRGSQLIINDQQVIGPRAPAVPDPAGGSNVDAEARATLREVLTVLRGHGLIDD